MSRWSDENDEASKAELVELPLEPIEFESPGRFALIKVADGAPGGLPEARPEELLSGSELVRFTSAQTARSLTFSIIAQARRGLSIFTPDLEPWLYDSNDMRQACLDFARQFPECRLRILVRDPSLIIRRGHRLLTLSRRLPSRIEIRHADPDQPTGDDAFLFADDMAMLWRPDAREHAGVACRHHPGRVRQLRARFDDAWKHSPFNADLRSLLL